MTEGQLVGIGLYTPAEAERLTGVSRSKVTRWLRGHDAQGKRYGRLWQPQIDIGDGRVYLGFRDLMEVRVANAFISKGLSAQKVRRAIELAGEMEGVERPLSTLRFRTDGRSVFLQMSREDGADHLIDLFRQQYAFSEVVGPSLVNIEFDRDGIPERWWPTGKASGIVVDPARSFGQPIDATTSVPVATLAAAAPAEGSVEAAARSWAVPIGAVRTGGRIQEYLRRTPIGGVKVFFDNCTSPVLAATLHGFISQASHSAIHIKDASCGRQRDGSRVDRHAAREPTQRWVVVTGDGASRRTRPSERLSGGRSVRVRPCAGLPEDAAAPSRVVSPLALAGDGAACRARGRYRHFTNSHDSFGKAQAAPAVTSRRLTPAPGRSRRSPPPTAPAPSARRANRRAAPPCAPRSAPR